MNLKALSPRSYTLAGLVCLLQLVVLVLPIPILGQSAAAILVLLAVSAYFILGSVSNATLFLIVVSSVIPGYISEEYLILPLGFKFGEALFLIVLFLALLHVLIDSVALPKTLLSRPVSVFLALVVFSCGVGLYLDHSISQMLRDVRYPLYYGLFFVVVAFFPKGKHNPFLSALLLVAAVVGVEYLVEFMSSVNLSISGTFERVARIEGLVLPMGTLLVGAAWLYAPSRTYRLVAGLALVPIGLSFVLTVGRGMWISAAVGFLALGFLYLRDRQRVGLRNAFLTVIVPLLVIGGGFVFQTITKTGVVAVATRRLARIETYEDDHSISGRLISYQNALTKILRRPVLGGGHGETVTFPVVKTAVPYVAILGGVDNVYLTILLRMGLVGLAAFVWIYLRGLQLAYRLFQDSDRQDERFFAASFFVIYSALLVYGAADSTMMTTRMIFIHAVALGILAQLTAPQADPA